MTDVFTKAKRSEVMSRIRGRGNKDTEVALAKLLRANGISGWRRHLEIRGRDAALRRPRPVQGRNHSGRVATLHASRTSQRDFPTFRVKPDFVFRQVRLALFVDGCFWHGCPRHATKPANNRAFWKKKLAGNKTRDRAVNRSLRRAGWRVLRIWECELRFPESCVRRILKKLKVDR
jgi:DNA mismatch endonuclease, patch repair protein